MSDISKKLKEIRKEINSIHGYTKLVSGGSVETYRSYDCVETYRSYDWLVEREKVLEIIDKHIKENK